MNRNGKRRQNISVSPCKCSLHSSVRRLEQPARCGWRGHAVEREPSPNRSQSSHSVCCACRQPRFLMRLTQLPLHSFVSLPHLPVWEEEEEESSGTPSDSPPFRSSASVNMESSVKGRPLRLSASQNRIGSLFRPHTAHISMTNM